MSSIEFLRQVLGAEGANALKKAAERAPVLDSVLIPRTIVAWLTTAIRLNYEGNVPGLDNSYIKVVKKSDESLDGLVMIGDTTYPFENSSVPHVAAAIGVALGAELKPIDEDLKEIELSQLGKSIDLLVKARICSEELAKNPPCEECGGDFAGQDDEGHWYCKAHGNKVKKFDQVHGQAHEPTEPVKPQAVQKQPQVSAKELKLSEKESQRECQDCGGKQFKGGKLVGCMCLRDLVKTAAPEVHMSRGILMVKFKKGIDEDAFSAFIKALKG